MLGVTTGFVKWKTYDKRQEIEGMIKDRGLIIVGRKDPYFINREMARIHYWPIRQKPYYEGAVEALFGPNGELKPVDMLLILGENAVGELADLVGYMDPVKAKENTIRKIFGEDIIHNGFHRADSKLSVVKELSIHWKREELPERVLQILKEYKKGFSVEENRLLMEYKNQFPEYVTLI